MTPTRFGYRLHSPLGKGTWGLFYSVEDPITGTPYALKLVRLDSKVDSQRLLQRLEREWTIGQSLTHSVLRRYHAFHRDPRDAHATASNTKSTSRPPNEVALVMELIDGWRMQARFNLAPTLDILRDVACAIASMHAQGFVHTSLSTGCLYLSTLSRPRLTGLGDAVRIGEVPLLRTGRPGSEAPELVHGKPAVPETDAFLFAVLTYNLVLNKYPSASRLPGVKGSAQLSDGMIAPDVPIHELEPALPVALADFVQRALHHDPAARPTVQSLLDELRWNDADRAAPMKDELASSPTIPTALVQRCARNPTTPEPRSEYPAQQLVLKSHAFGYRIGRWLGDGAWSRIYLVQQPGSNDAFALKHVVLTSRYDSRLRDSICNELKYCQKFKHPALRGVYELHSVDGDLATATIYGLVMELLDATTLTEEGLSDKLLVHDVLDVLKSSASALAHIHEHGLVHTNFKPRSIFRSHLGRTKVAELGQMIPSGTALERSRATPGFAAREIVLGDRVTDRSDSFAYAATAYNLVTGRIAPRAAEVKTKGKPFDARDIGPETPLDELNPMIPTEFSRLCDRALRSDPDSRPSMAEIVQSLR